MYNPSPGSYASNCRQGEHPEHTDVLVALAAHDPWYAGGNQWILTMGRELTILQVISDRCRLRICGKSTKVAKRAHCPESLTLPGMNASIKLLSGTPHSSAVKFDLDSSSV
jgi:hypothetical protein